MSDNKKEYIFFVNKKKFFFKKNLIPHNFTINKETGNLLISIVVRLLKDGTIGTTYEKVEINHDFSVPQRLLELVLTCLQNGLPFVQEGKPVTALLVLADLKETNKTYQIDE